MSRTTALGGGPTDHVSTPTRAVLCPRLLRVVERRLLLQDWPKQEGLAVASIARDDPSTLPGDDPFPRARMHRDRNAR